MEGKWQYLFSSVDNLICLHYDFELGFSMWLRGRRMLVRVPFLDKSFVGLADSFRGGVSGDVEHLVEVRGIVHGIG